MTGHPDQLPIEPYCVGDPNAGLHAVLGTMLALEHRDRTGEGTLVEVAMVDAALNVAAEQVIEHSAYGALLERAGNRGPCAAPQNLYRTAGLDGYGREDCWVAIAVATDEQWLALRKALGEPGWTTDPAFDTATGRAGAVDTIDEHLAEWCRTRTSAEVVACLWEVGVPVGEVVLPHLQPELAQLAARRFFEEVDHPVVGRSRYSTIPMRFSRGPDRVHARHAPLLGEHTTEVLTELGLRPEEIEALEADGIIGRTLGEER
jgi:crotonobetainyl-CoA:carnitine CoA-transferase CaiB-like acyl-CoA transferase